METNKQRKERLQRHAELQQNNNRSPGSVINRHLLNMINQYGQDYTVRTLTRILNQIKREAKASQKVG